ncbi:hypothetical protein ARC20_03200 [Stenotrophomonas panacihumi]|uniref:DUF2190 domain-containing protein n=1 Tax=Stenotrophomonas panacihumi TaxID=676599 RepID=A0A0R0B0G2_9GAMM|nr:DUF2190 family protein [Stenotrophomonas panacihumi]KRG47351.1 hypothetical protein ARC20_03200 [Stenotrophomonas panacihumi]PTN55828.1 hypothetical protein C9J98_04440 [Stenotrophomonas panacihumi]
MALQTNYPDNQPAAVAGAQATMVPATIISRTVEGAAIAFGKPVQQGATDKSVAAFTTGKFVGITLLDRSASGLSVSGGQVTGRAVDSFGVGESARVSTKGDIWVVAAVAVAAGDAVYVTPTGTFTNVATSNTAIAGARWDTSTTAAGQLAVVRLG